MLSVYTDFDWNPDLNYSQLFSDPSPIVWFQRSRNKVEKSGVKHGELILINAEKEVKAALPVI